MPLRVEQMCISSLRPAHALGSGPVHLHGLTLHHPCPGLRTFFSVPPPRASFQLGFQNTLASHPLTLPLMIHKSGSF